MRVMIEFDLPDEADVANVVATIEDVVGEVDGSGQFEWNTEDN